MKRVEAARTGAQKLMQTEAAIDQALRQTAELVALLPSLRMDTGLSAVVGQEAVETVGEALSHILTARRTIVKAHGDLQAVREQIGCRAVAMGVLDKPADGDKPRTNGLHIVPDSQVA